MAEDRRAMYDGWSVNGGQRNDLMHVSPKHLRKSQRIIEREQRILEDEQRRERLNARVTEADSDADDF
jgi:hypothetical protein